MLVYPDTAAIKLGFDGVLDEIAQHLYASSSRSRLISGSPIDDREVLLQRLKRVSELQDMLRFDDSVPFASFEDIREHLRTLGPEDSYVDAYALKALAETLRISRLVSGYLEHRKAKYPELHRVFVNWTPLEHIEQRIEQIVDKDGMIKDTASEELRRIRQQIIKQQAALREELSRALRKAVGQGYATEGQPTLRSGRMVIPVRAEAKRKVEGFVHDVSATGQTVYIEPASCLALNNEVRSMEAAERQEVIRILKEVANQIREHTETISHNQELLESFDRYQARARWANKHEAVIPEIPAIPLIDIRLGRNPVLESHFLEDEDHEARRSVVPLNLQLGDAYRTLVITGPNAGGKSVAMKTVGLFALMLAHGLPLPLKETSRFGLFRRLYVDLGDEQSIEKDLSTFSSHVQNLRNILVDADENSLVLIDEAGTGTDPAEGGALAQSVLETLTARGVCTLVTTHHGALKVYAHTADGVENGSMQFDRETLEPTYKFQAGVPGSSFAFEISERMGLQGDVLKRARELVGDQKMNVEELLANLEARGLELERQLITAREESNEASKAREKHDRLRKELSERKLAIQEAAIKEADEVVRRANAAVERTIREIKESQAGKEATKAARQALESFKEDVEEQYRKTRKKRKVHQKKRTATAKGGGNVIVGDQVVLDDGNTACEVIEIDGEEAVILSGAMHMRVKRNRLRKVGGKRKQQVRVKQVSKAKEPALSSLKAKTAIDLRGARVEEALIQVTNMIDEAVAANLDKVEILHGKGTGALKSAIRSLLKERPDVERFEEPPWNEGGAGITRVVLKR